MESKKITQLATEVAPLLDDLTFIGDPITGQLKKVTLNQIAYIFGAGSAWGTITGTLSNQTDLQAALNLKANDNAVVHLTGTETIAGAKTFSDLITFNYSNTKVRELTLFGHTGTHAGALHLYHGESPTSFDQAGYTDIWSDVSSVIFNIRNTAGTNGIKAILDYSGLTDNSIRTYAYPNTSGTLALTSDLTSFITLTSLSASSPLAYNNTTGAFSIQVANTSQNGYLSSTDWNTFNNKQATLTLTTTGSSGSATLISNTLNVPTYTLSGLGGQPQLNGTGFVKASGTTISYDNTTYQPLLTNPVTGTGTTNYVPKFTGSSTIGDSLIQSNTYVIGIGGGVASWDLNYRSINLYGINNYITGADNGALYLGNGAYFNSGWKYSNGNSPTQISMETGSFTFKVALGGTTGNAISWITGLSVAAGTGNVIIGGATDAGFKLDVNGTARVSSSVQGGSFYVPSTTFGISPTPSYQTIIKYGNTNTFAEIQGGNLNQSDFSTFLKFRVNGTASNTPIDALTIAPTGTATFSGSVTIGNGTTTTSKLTILATTGVAAPGSPSLGIYDVSNPSYGFDFDLEGVATGDLYLSRLVAGTRTAVLQLSRSTGAATFSSSLITNGSSIDINPSSGQPNITLRSGNTFRGYIEGNSSGGLSFGAGTSANIYLTINSSGNVGIGTSSPSAKLSVNANAVGVLANISDGIAETLQISTGSGYVSFLNPNSGVIAFRDSTNAVERMRINSSGNLLIGTTGLIVGAKMQLKGDVNSSAMSIDIGTNGYPAISFQNSSGAQQGYIVTNASSVQYLSISDYRLKQDFKDFKGIALIELIKVYDYQWKQDNTRSYGVKAHELQQIIPQSVFGEKDGEQMQGVDYSKIVPVLIKSVQELQAQIEELKALINK